MGLGGGGGLICILHLGLGEGRKSGEELLDKKLDVLLVQEFILKSKQRKIGRIGFQVWSRIIFDRVLNFI